MSTTSFSPETELPYYSSNHHNPRSRSTASPTQQDDFDKLLRRLRLQDPQLAHAVTHFEHRRPTGTLTAIGEPWFTREETLNIMKRALDGTLDEADATDGSQSDTDSLGGAGAGALDGMSEASEDHYIEVAQPPSSPSKEDRALLLEAVSLIAKRRKEQERISAEDRVIHFDINGAEVNAPTGLRSLAELVGEATMKGKKSRLHLRGGDTNNRDVGGQGDGEERGGRKRSDSGAFERDFALLNVWKEMQLDGNADQADHEAMGPAARAEKKKLQKEGKLPAEEKPSEAVQKSSRVGDTHCTAIDDHAGVLEKAGEENKASVADRVSARLTSVTGK